MRIAFCIGSYRLVDFVHLGLKQLRLLVGDFPILVSDDAAPESGSIKNLAHQHDAAYSGSNKRRGHFASDCQAFVNALSFAEAAGADIAVKVSQRFIFRRPEVIAAITDAFADPNILVVTPGQPKVGTIGNGRPMGFGAFTCLSDIVAIRVGAVSPTEMLHMYRERLLREKVPWGSFLECLIDEFHHAKFPGRTSKLEQITNHSDIENPIYLRRYQNGEHQYRALAAERGIAGQFPLGEWGSIEGRNYISKPMCV